MPRSPLGTAVRTYRTDRNLTQHQLAEVLKTSRNRISQLESPSAHEQRKALRNVNLLTLRALIDWTDRQVAQQYFSTIFATRFAHEIELLSMTDAQFSEGTKGRLSKSTVSAIAHNDYTLVDLTHFTRSTVAMLFEVFRWIPRDFSFEYFTYLEGSSYIDDFEWEPRELVEPLIKPTGGVRWLTQALFKGKATFRT